MSVTISNLTATWSNTAVQYTAIKMNVANNGSAAGSKLMDLQANGTSLFTVFANGSTTIGGADVLTTIDNRVTPAFNKANAAAFQTLANATVDLSANKYTFDLSASQNFVANFDRRAKILGGSVQYAPKPITYLGFTSASGTTTLTLPAGLQQGDLVLLIQGSDDGTPVTPSGWTQLFAGRDANSVGYGLAWKIMGETPDTTVTVIGAANDANIAVAYRGVDQTTPVEVVGTLAAAATLQPNPSLITVLTDGSEVVAIGWLDDDIAFTPTPPFAFNSSTLAFRNSTGSGFTVMSASRTWSAATIDPGAFGGGDDAWEAVAIALKPANNRWAIDLPSGLIANDVVFMQLTGGGKVPDIITSGWVDTGYSVIQTAGYGTYADIYYKAMDSTPDSNVTITVASDIATASLVAVRNIDLDGLINGAIVSGPGGTNDPAPAAITPTNNHTFILAGGFIEARSPTAALTTPTPNVSYLQSANTSDGIPFSTFIEGYAREFGTGISFNPADLNDGATGWIPSTAAIAWEWTIAFNSRPPRIEFVNVPGTGLGYNAIVNSQNYTDFVEWPQSVLFSSSVPGSANGWPIFTTNGGTLYRLYKFDATQYATGQEVYTTAGTYTWTVPANVTSISAVAVGGGGGGLLQGTGGGGGAGGDLRYSSGTSVTPGETLTILVGAAGTTGASPTDGGFTRISRANGQTLLLAAGGGRGQGPTLNSATSNGTSSNITLPTRGLTYTFYTLGSAFLANTESSMNTLFNTATVTPTVTLGGSGVHQGTINWGDSGQTGAGGATGTKPTYLPANRFSWVVDGYILAPETGTYRFGVDGDDAVDVFVNGVNVANYYGGHDFNGFWTGGISLTGPTQVSNTISLVAGQYYTFRARHQDGDGGDGIQVGWQKPSDSSISLIPATAFYYALDGNVTLSGVGIGGGNGGAAGAGAASGSSGGGGAGGYFGAGGGGAGSTALGGFAAATNSGGGGGGASGDISNDRSGAGGGVGILGYGTDGTGGAYAAPTGGDGTAGSSGSGVTYGGGAGSSDSTGTIPTGAGGGAARIIWGRDTDGTTIRTYPSTSVTSLASRDGFNYILRATPETGYRVDYY